LHATQRDGYLATDGMPDSGVHGFVAVSAWLSVH
jgi:hypothetical protein